MVTESSTRLPPLTDRTMVSFRAGTLEVIDGMAAEAGYKVRGDYIREILEREIATCRPADFKRLRGVEGVE